LLLQLCFKRTFCPFFCLERRRKKENDLRKVDSDFQLKLRLDKVDCIQKTSLYNRQQLLERIMNDNDMVIALFVLVVVYVACVNFFVHFGSGLRCLRNFHF